MSSQALSDINSGMYFTPDYSLGVSGASTYSIFSDMMDNAIRKDGPDKPDKPTPFDLIGAVNQLNVTTDRERRYFDALRTLRHAVTNVAYFSVLSKPENYCHVELRDATPGIAEDARVVFQMDILSTLLMNGMITLTRALALYDVTHLTTDLYITIKMPTAWIYLSGFNLNDLLLNTPYPGLTSTNYKSFSESTRTITIQLGKATQTNSTLGKVIVPTHIPTSGTINIKQNIRLMFNTLKKISC